MTNKEASIDFTDFENAADASVMLAQIACAQDGDPVSVDKKHIDASKIYPLPPKSTRVGIDWGQDKTTGSDVDLPTPQQLLAQEIKSAQAAADANSAKRLGFVGEYQRRALEIRSLRERLAKLELAQKGTIARIKFCDKAAAAHRQNIFALQEAGR
ncbi:hypothetical protein PQB34_gp68 [Ochrobactrum phage POI1126]|uniref:Uncharacterized protein n=1 Tax=Ochrobactrum phage POI1126 TaxID=1932118 RepID=A0A240F4W7_9CAUD|nr:MULTISPECIES: hypothetical protein [Brucella]YP_010665209.1 hypothetical protein PQB34_gp68 [Ochrobactrum phage POI1126]KFH18587.1 hypothetical protein IB60_16495 [Brucella abortus LMN1]KFH24311.1 hypothetical protein IB61_11695 [Brucella abortus LMN2]APU92996.1 hypothetical protein POI1126_70 [Ochrobactrum phage POI1126]RUQ67052.1 hypothetical protein ELZ23_15900 [Brucella abortus]RUQ78107.1 hypothetical protein ELZ22_17440 [Brucella abortus]